VSSDRKKHYATTQSDVKMHRCISLTSNRVVKSNNLTTDKVCSIQTTARNHNITDAVQTNCDQWWSWLF